MNKSLKKSTVIIFSIFVSLILLAGIFVNKTTPASAGRVAPEWKPFNYVLNDASTGFKSEDVRTSLSYDGGKLTASGMTTRGGMGVMYIPEISIDNFEMNVSLKEWNSDDSGDRWFGLSFTNVGERTDRYNEVPFYSKHSETCDGNYGRGVLFAVRPSADGASTGKLTVQFNYLGIYGTIDTTTNLPITNAGDDSDEHNFGWARSWVKDIQLYNSDWSVKTNYDDLKITLKKFGSGESTEYGFDINGGYWKWLGADIEASLNDTNTLDQIIIDKLQIRKGDKLTQAQKDRVLYGPAKADSIVPYLNFGDTYNALYKFAQRMETENKRLYMSFMYKDKSNIMEGNDPAKFIINSVNGANATTGSETSLVLDKKVEGEISATLKETNLHAGVYPSKVNSLQLVDAEKNTYNKAESAIKNIAGKNSYKVVNVKGKTENGENVSIINPVDVTFNLTGYKNAKLYKLTGNSESADIDELGGISGATYKVNSSNVNFILVYEGGGGGCGSAVSLTFIPALMMLCVGALLIKRRMLSK